MIQAPIDSTLTAHRAPKQVRRWGSPSSLLGWRLFTCWRGEKNSCPSRSSPAPKWPPHQCSFLLAQIPHMSHSKAGRGSGQMPAPTDNGNWSCFDGNLSPKDFVPRGGELLFSFFCIFSYCSSVGHYPVLVWCARTSFPYCSNITNVFTELSAIQNISTS